MDEDEQSKEERTNFFLMWCNAYIEGREFTKQDLFSDQLKPDVIYDFFNRALNFLCTFPGEEPNFNNRSQAEIVNQVNYFVNPLRLNLIDLMYPDHHIHTFIKALIEKMHQYGSQLSEDLSIIKRVKNLASLKSKLNEEREKYNEACIEQEILSSKITSMKQDLKSLQGTVDKQGALYKVKEKSNLDLVKQLNIAKENEDLLKKKIEEANIEFTHDSDYLSLRERSLETLKNLLSRIKAYEQNEESSDIALNEQNIVLEQLYEALKIEKLSCEELKKIGQVMAELETRRVQLHDSANQMNAQKVSLSHQEKDINSKLALVHSMESRRLEWQKSKQDCINKLIEVKNLMTSQNCHLMQVLQNQQDRIHVLEEYQ